MVCVRHGAQEIPDDEKKAACYKPSSMAIEAPRKRWWSLVREATRQQLYDRAGNLARGA